MQQFFLRYFIQELPISATICCWQDNLEKFDCTLRCAAIFTGRTLCVTPTQLSEIVVLGPESTKQTTNNESFIFSTCPILGVWGHKYTRSVAKNKIWKPVHRGVDGPVLKISPGDTSCVSNCHCSSNYICRPLISNLVFRRRH